MKRIDISDWQYLEELEKAQIETDAYEHILELLVDNGIPISNEHCQYYEQKYLESYFILFDLKNRFTFYIANKINKNFIRNWEIDFMKKEVVLYEK